MKYTIHGLQQEKLIKFELDNDDALILSVFKEMYCSPSIESKIIDEERYIWINQKNLIENQIPIVGSRAKIMRKLKNLEEKGYIKRKVLFLKNGVKGKYSYLTITPKLESLSEYTISQNETTPCIKTRLPLYQNETTLVSKCYNKDSPIIDSPIIDSSIIDINKVIETWNSLNLNKLVSIKNKRLDSLKARVKEFGFDEVIKAIESINNSKFLQGGNNRNWKITFDWFLKPNNFVKVLEGNYLSNNKEEKINGNEYNFKFD